MIVYELFKGIAITILRVRWITSRYNYGFLVFPTRISNYRKWLPSGTFQSSSNSKRNDLLSFPVWQPPSDPSPHSAPQRCGFFFLPSRSVLGSQKGGSGARACLGWRGEKKKKKRQKWLVSTSNNHLRSLNRMSVISLFSMCCIDSWS